MFPNTGKSAQLYQRALKSLVEGVSSPSRGRANYEPYPIFMDHGQGPYLFDVDGNRYIDFMMAYGALPLGHAHPRIVATIERVAKGGTLFATAAEIEVVLAEKLRSMLPGAEKVRFANTGTEAAMGAIRLARGYTGRHKFIKFEGHYHGWYDAFLVNAHPQPLVSLGHPHDPIRIPDSSGIPPAALENTIVVPWNDITALERAIASHPGQIGAVITEGIMANMGVIPPQPGYLQALRALTEEHGILLILDETVTGFRVAPGGCAEHYGVVPDIATYGKALGCGYPVAAITGKAHIMEALSWGGVLHYGTQNAPRLGLEIAKASLDELSHNNNAGFKHLWQLGERLQNGIREAIKVTHSRAIVQGVGPMFQLFFTTAEAIQDYRAFCKAVDRKRFQRFAQELLKRGIYLSPSAALHSVTSLAHTEEDVEITLTVVGEALEAMRG